MEINRVGGINEIIRGNQLNNSTSSDIPNTSDVQATSEKEIIKPISSNESVGPDILKDSVRRMNDVFEALTTHLKFQLHEGTGKYYVAVVNEFTNKVVREIPPKKFLDMVAYMEKQMKGIFVDETK